MKRIIACMLIAVFALSFLTACSEEKMHGNPDAQKVAVNPDPNADILEDTPETPITLAVNNTEVAAGDTFTISVRMENTEWSWNSFEFSASYDPEIIEVISIKKTELTSEMMDTSNPNYGENGDQIRVAYASATELEGGGDIVEIECKALKAGSFEMVLSDSYMCRWVTYAATGEGGPREIPVKLESGTVTVK
ncbi:MAG: hypothetical protein IJO93_03760 [Clostridia bacterium]|nr:hypothetical protein [Clostridia bacterium]